MKRDDDGRQSRLPFMAGSETSKLAAERAQARAASQREQVYDFFVICREYGALDEEVQHGLGMNGNTERPRRCELTNAGRLRHRKGHVRPTKSGNSANVWIVNEHPFEIGTKPCGHCAGTGRVNKVIIHLELCPTCRREGLLKMNHEGLLERWCCFCGKSWLL